MSDVFSPEKRSWIMSRVKGKNTKPEMLVRRVVHGMGFRYRLHVKDLPGKPDIVLARHRKVIFVHGCFWHGHDGCSRATRPEGNAAFWDCKISGNRDRDKRQLQQLEDMGWRVLTVWQCETRDAGVLAAKLKTFLKD